MAAFAEATGIRAYRYERPPFGRFGEVATIGDRLVCHLCGRDFVFLGGHILRKHGIDAREYRRIFGLTRRHALCTERLSRRRAETVIANGGAARLGRIDVTRDTTRAVAASSEARSAERLLGWKSQPAPINAIAAAARIRSSQSTCLRGHLLPASRVCIECRRLRGRAYDHRRRPARGRTRPLDTGLTCTNGHPWTTANVVTGLRQRSCRLCSRAAEARYRARLGGTTI